MPYQAATALLDAPVTCDGCGRIVPAGEPCIEIAPPVAECPPWCGCDLCALPIGLADRLAADRHDAEQLADAR